MKPHSLLLFPAMALLFACGGGDEKEKSDNVPDNDSSVTAKAPVDTFTVFARVQFPSKDGIMITGDSYEVIPGSQYILLCHQAGFSRGEYRETAKKLSGMGYNCLAIDLRSGKNCNGIENETAAHAAEKGVSSGYLDAEQDIEAALDYIYNLTYNKTHHKVIVVGSSYSASLALKMAINNERIMAVAAFSPGEYLKGIELAKLLKGLTKPVFATSSLEENEEVVTLLGGITDTHKTVYKPSAEGDHGSRVLWPESQSQEEYWTAFTSFLNRVSTQAAQ
jgi:dienelactone hydrolase